MSSRQDHLKRLIKTHTATLLVVEEQIAGFGGSLHAPAHLLVQRNTLGADIEQLQLELQAEQRRLELLLKRVPKKRRVSSERVPGEWDLDIVKNRDLRFVFLSGLTGKPLTYKAIRKIAAEVMDYHHDLNLGTTVWIEYRDWENRFFLLRLMWQAWPRRILKVERRGLAYEEVEQWLGLPHSPQAGPVARSAYAAAG